MESELSDIILRSLPAGLKEFIDFRFKKYQKLHRRNNEKNCDPNNPCSKRRVGFDQWCTTCRQWKNYVLDQHKCDHFPLRWDSLDSSKIPNDVNEFRKCFYKSSSHNMADATNCFYILQHCKLFDDINCDALSGVKLYRDLYCHGYRLAVANKCKDLLDLVNQCDPIEQFPKIQNVKEKTLSLLHKIDINRAPSNSITLPSLGRHGRLILLMVSMITLWTLLDRDDYHYLQAGSCFPDKKMKFSCTLKRHTDFVGREWLFNEIDDLLNASNHDRGILLLADMGYGKSAFVSEILCPRSSHQAMRINQKVVAFHLCEQSTLLFRSAEHFIHNIRIMLHDNIQEFQLVEGSQDQESECKLDLISCYKNWILEPLSNIPNKKYNLLFIIEAVDECGIEDYSSIYNIMVQTYRFHPKWLKILFTAQNNKHIQSHFRGLRTLKLSMFDEKNKEDILTYLHMKKGYFEEYELPRKRPPLFLYVRYLMNHWRPGKDLPSCVFGIYEQQLRRVFGFKNKEFRKYHDLFAVLAVARYPFTEDTLFETIKTPKPLEFKQMLHKISRFLLDGGEDGIIQLAHESLGYFLTAKVNGGLPFFINKSRGHDLISKFIFHRLYDGSENVITLAKHVAMSGNLGLVDDFKSLPAKFFASRFVMDLKQRVTPLQEFVATDDLDTKEANLGFRLLMSVYNMTDIEIAIYFSVIHGRSSAIEILLQRNPGLEAVHTETFCKINAPYRNERYTDVLSPVHVAVIKNQSGIASQLLHYKPEAVNFATGSGLDVLTLALLSGKCEMTPFIIRKHDINLHFAHLYHAVVQNCSTAVIRLLRRGISDQCPTCNKYGLLQSKTFTVFQLQTNVHKINNSLNLKSIPKRGELIMNAWCLTCESALFAAVRLGFADIVDLLLKSNNATWNCRDIAGMTPFEASVMYYQYRATNMLLRNNATSSGTCKPLTSELYKRLQILADFGMVEEMFPRYKCIKLCPSGENVHDILRLRRYSGIQIRFLPV